jgi:hypothetical protein
VAARRSDGKISKRVIELASTSTVVAQQFNSIVGTLSGDVDVATAKTARRLMFLTTSAGHGHWPLLTHPGAGEALRAGEAFAVARVDGAVMRNDPSQRRRSWPE